ASRSSLRRPPTSASARRAVPRSPDPPVVARCRGYTCMVSSSLRMPCAARTQNYASPQEGPFTARRREGNSAGGGVAPLVAPSGGTVRMRFRILVCLLAALVCAPAIAAAQTPSMFSNAANPAIGMNALFTGQAARALNQPYGLGFDEA